MILPSDKSTSRLGERNPTRHRKQGHSSRPAFEIGLPCSIHPFESRRTCHVGGAYIMLGILLRIEIGTSCHESTRFLLLQFWKSHEDFLDFNICTTRDVHASWQCNWRKISWSTYENGWHLRNNYTHNKTYFILILKLVFVRIFVLNF